jgi:predicted SprT family Zn-dependent metalloprotease
MNKNENCIKIPESFDLFGQTITVKYDENLGFDKQCYGIADYDKNLILIQPDVKGCNRGINQIEQTYLHEVTHFILHRCGYSKLTRNEDFVDSFSNALHQILKTSEYDKEVPFVEHKVETKIKTKKDKTKKVSDDLMTNFG